jgi:hypothetical protein
MSTRVSGHDVVFKPAIESETESTDKVAAADTIRAFRLSEEFGCSRFR